MAHSVTIELEALRPDHVDGMFAGLSDPSAYAFMPEDPPADVEALRRRYGTRAIGHSPDGAERWLNWVIRLSSDGACLGYTQATITGPGALIAYHVFPAFWRLGIGRRAMSITLNRLFAADVERATALVDTRNVASLALLRRLGFTCVRTIENADFFKGRSSDEHEFELRRSAWHG